MFSKQRLTGSIDWYYRKTSDLLNNATVPAGANFRNQVMSNIGSMYNMGVETSLHWLAVNAKDFNWTMDYNFTYNYIRLRTSMVVAIQTISYQQEVSLLVQVVTSRHSM